MILGIDSKLSADICAEVGRRGYSLPDLRLNMEGDRSRGEAEGEASLASQLTGKPLCTSTTVAWRNAEGGGVKMSAPDGVRREARLLLRVFHPHAHSAPGWAAPCAWRGGSRAMARGADTT